VIDNGKEVGGETLPATSQRGKSPKAGKGVGRKALPPTKVVSVRLPMTLIDAHNIDSAWLFDAVSWKTKLADGKGCWLSEEDEQLIKLKSSGLSFREISTMMRNRTMDSCSSRYKYLRDTGRS
jgi:hypothetical protein